MKNEIRLNIKANRAQIEALKEIAEIGSNQELLNNAIALFAWAIKEKAEGNIVGSINETSKPNSYKEIIMPALERVTK